MSELLDHEAVCPDAVQCPFCGIELAKMDYDFHLQRCPEVAMCRFCGLQFAASVILKHEAECPDAADCPHCGLRMPKNLLELHIVKNCPKARAGVPEGEDVDPRAYQEKKDKNLRKLKRDSKDVIVEDDFIEPGDFRDPGGRKQNTDTNPSSFGSGPQKFKHSKTATARVDSTGIAGLNDTGNVSADKRDGSKGKPPLSPNAKAQSPKSGT